MENFIFCVVLDVEALQVEVSPYTRAQDQISTPSDFSELRYIY